MHVYENVERVRIVSGLSKRELAHRIGLSDMGYNHISTGKVKLTVDRLQEIARVFGVDPAIFYDDESTDAVVFDFIRTKREPNEKVATEA